MLGLEGMKSCPTRLLHNLALNVILLPRLVYWFGPRMLGISQTVGVSRPDAHAQPAVHASIR
jgi:hypothetical protein